MEDCQAIELNGQSLEIVEKFRYLDNKTGARGVVVDSAITRIKRGFCKSQIFIAFVSQ